MTATAFQVQIMHFQLQHFIAHVVSHTSTPRAHHMLTMAIPTGPHMQVEVPEVVGAFEYLATTSTRGHQPTLTRRPAGSGAAYDVVLSDDVIAADAEQLSVQSGCGVTGELLGRVACAVGK